MQVASDLHIEHRSPVPGDLVAPTDAPVLALVGDIGSPTLPSYASFVASVAARHDHVIILAGNHEYYGGRERDSPTMADLLCLMREACAPHPNVHLLDDESIVIDGVRYIGSTLWSHVPDVLAPRCTRGMNDYALIRVHHESAPDAALDAVHSDRDDDHEECRSKGPDEGARDGSSGLLTVADTNALHAASVEFIDGEVREAEAAGQTAVVLTHHAPSFKSIHRRYALSPLTCAFATDLEERLMRPPVALWLHGHTHAACDYVVQSPAVESHRVRVVNNPAGYPFEKDTGYRNDLVVEVDV